MAWLLVLAGGLLFPLLVVGLIGRLLRVEPEAIAGTRWLGPAGTLLAALAALAALPGDAPLEVLLPHLFIDESEAHHRRAVERIRALPDLTARLAAQSFGPGRVEAEVKERRAAVAQWPNEGPRSDALEILDLCLAGKAVPEPGGAGPGPAALLSAG